MVAGCDQVLRRLGGLGAKGCVIITSLPINERLIFPCYGPARR